MGTDKVRWRGDETGAEASLVDLDDRVLFDELYADELVQSCGPRREAVVCLSRNGEEHALVDLRDVGRAERASASSLHASLGSGSRGKGGAPYSRTPARGSLSATAGSGTGAGLGAGTDLLDDGAGCHEKVKDAVLVDVGHCAGEGDELRGGGSTVVSLGL